MELKRGSQAGFTIIESMVAMLILLVGLMALAMLQNVAFRANSLARNRTTATIMASERIERLSRLGVENVADGSSNANVEGQDFNASWEADPAPSVNNNAEIVQMEVGWSDNWSATNKVKLPTVVR